MVARVGAGFQGAKGASTGFWTLYTLKLEDTLELASLDVQFSVADIYQNTSLVEIEHE